MDAQVGVARQCGEVGVGVEVTLPAGSTHRPRLVETERLAGNVTKGKVDRFARSRTRGDKPTDRCNSP